MPSVIRIRRPGPGVSPERGLIDTSVVIGLPSLGIDQLPAEIAISALTLAELSTGPHATRDELERARRQDVLQRVESQLESLPFDAACARAFGRVGAAIAAMGRRARGGRFVDLLIAATALGNQLPLYTLNAADLRGLGDLIEVVDLAQ